MTVPAGPVAVSVKVVVAETSTVLLPLAAIAMPTLLLIVTDVTLSVLHAKTTSVWAVTVDGVAVKEITAGANIEMLEPAPWVKSKNA